MNNLTYFLGAGASCGNDERKGIPILKDFNKELKDFRDNLVKNRFHEINVISELNDNIWKPVFNTGKLELNITNNIVHDDRLERFLMDTKIIFDDLENHSTVDTLAKRYFLNNSKVSSTNELINLKSLLIIYFLHIQFTLKSKDIRYDNFVSTLLDYDKHSGNHCFPANLKMVTWNYDMQMEMTLTEYTNESISTVQSNFDFYPMTFDEKDLDINGFQFVRLNGLAGLFGQQNNLPKLTLIEDIYKGRIAYEELINLYCSLSKNKNITAVPFFRYAFEEEPNVGYDGILNQHEETIKISKKIFSKTDKLVIIGYSFPPFNRQVDLELFNALPDGCKIFVQDKNINMSKNIHDFFPSLIYRDIEVETINDLSQFYIPASYFEYDLNNRTPILNLNDSKQFPLK